MIIIVVLMAFLTMSFYVIDSYQSSISTNSYVQSVYGKVQALYIADAGFNLAKYILDNDDQSIDSLQDKWTLPFNYSQNNVKVSISIYDENRYINLNLAGDPGYGKIVDNLFKNLMISPEKERNLLVWIGRQEGTLQTGYPVKKAHMDSLYELILIGFKDEDLNGKLVEKDFYPGLIETSTVYTNGKININTAPLWVLKSLDERIDDNLAQKIIEKRSKEPFKQVKDLILVDGFTFDMLYKIQNYIDVKSDIFHVVVNVGVGSTELKVDYVYDRVGKRIIYKEIL
ncbi:type II secretion system protein GspK [Sulfurihydrogenibium sp.]|jgi:general secretion pathway protein K|uniref:general secretion pathway protein GspK n=1 Tax=Sulfurihydrogenibium sp. TaxID=2053621 RepID=UPI00263225DC|nr:type II secretion system protein GspK [Sulfurihydrogenibium sp.]